METRWYLLGQSGGVDGSGEVLGDVEPKAGHAL